MGSQASKLTDVELEMMSIIWNIGPCTIHQMLEELARDRDLAYTSVSTIVRILEQKKYVKSHKEGRGYLYSAVVSKEDYQNRSLHFMVTHVFDGTPASLVRQLVQSDSLSKKDIEDIKALLNKRS